MAWSKDVDDEVLIAAIQSRPAIYDKGHRNHHNRPHIGRAWENVAKEVGTDANSCRRRWQTVRDYFVRIQRVSKNAAQEGTPIRRIKWHLYDQMSFLIPMCVENESCKIIKKDKNDIEVDEDEISYEGEELSPSQSVLSDEIDRNIMALQETSHQRKRKTPSISSTERSDTGYNKTLRSSVEPQPPMDHNELFFKSLIPSVETLDDIQVMEFRIEVQGLLLKYMKSAKQSGSSLSGSASTSCVGTPMYDEVNGHVHDTPGYKAESQSSNQT